MKQTIQFVFLSCIAALCCLANDPRTFIQLGENVFSATNGWNIIMAQGERSVGGELDEEDADGNAISRFVLPHTPMEFQLKTGDHKLMVLQFSSTLAGEWTNRTFRIHMFTNHPSGLLLIPSRQNREIQLQNGAFKGFLIHETQWNPTNCILTSAAVDFQGGKVRFNSDIP